MSFLLDQFTFFGDPFFNDVVLLCPFDGTNGSTSFPDLSNSAHTLTAHGAAQLSTTNPKFGTACLLLDGSSAYVTIPDSADWDLGTGDFTIECFVNLNSYAGSPYLISRRLDAGNFWGIVFDASAGLQFTAFSASVNTINAAQGSLSGWSAGTYYHVAATRSGSTFRLFRAGIEVGTGTSSATVPDLSDELQIGAINGSLFLDGRVDEFRITKGVARYTANFAPPDAPFPTYGG